jgi:hypothetical protein
MPTAADRPGGRRFKLPLEMVLIGAACLACCLPLLGGVLAVVGGVLDTWTILAAGFAVWLAAGLGILTVAAVVVAWRWQTHYRPRCGTCGARRCAC